MGRHTALAPRYLGVSKVEIIGWLKENPCVENWLKKFRLSVLGEREKRLNKLKESEEKLSGSRLNKARMVCRFFKWLRVVKDIDLKPLELLNRQLQLRQSRNVQDRRWLVNLVLEHSRDNPDFAEYADRRKYDIFHTVKSFCDFHEVPLTMADNVFGSKRKKKNHRKQITLMETKELFGHLSQRDRTILFIILQSGMELGAVLHKMSYIWHSQVEPQLNAGCKRLKIEFDERKGNGTYYFTFVSRDGIHELQKWLIERKKIIENLLQDGKDLSKSVIEGEPIFITNRGNPLREQMFAHQLKEKTSGKVTSHMFRKLFESEAKVPKLGIDREYIKFWMGHTPKMDEAGGTYDRNPEIKEQICEREYEKLEPIINIYSSPVASRRTDPLLADIQNVMQEEGGRDFFKRLLKRMDEETSEWLAKKRK